MKTKPGQEFLSEKAKPILAKENVKCASPPFILELCLLLNLFLALAIFKRRECYFETKIFIFKFLAYLNRSILL